MPINALHTNTQHTHADQRPLTRRVLPGSVVSLGPRPALRAVAACAAALRPRSPPFCVLACFNDNKRRRRRSSLSAARPPPAPLKGASHLCVGALIGEETCAMRNVIREGKKQTGPALSITHTWRPGGRRGGRGGRRGTPSLLRASASDAAASALGLGLAHHQPTPEPSKRFFGAPPRSNSEALHSETSRLHGWPCRVRCRLCDALSSK